MRLIIPEYIRCKHNLFYALIKVAIQKNVYVDVNPVIVTSEGEIVLAKKTKGTVWEKDGTCLKGGRRLMRRLRSPLTMGKLSRILSLF